MKEPFKNQFWIALVNSIWNYGVVVSIMILWCAFFQCQIAYDWPWGLRMIINGSLVMITFYCIAVRVARDDLFCGGLSK